GVRRTTREGACLTGTGSLEGIPVLLALTEIVMNRSGKAVADLLARRHLGPEDLLLLHDDLDLQPGRIKIKIRGRHGGHHGVESVITHVGTEAFLRIKIETINRLTDDHKNFLR
ncbi:MAG: hypothetical protein IH830_02215, partial [Planctomycetes bacterium]|nr:hypothetical protein [Planctomycetota bacterium]